MIAGLPLPSRAADMMNETTAETPAFGDKKLAARSKLKKLDLSGLGIVAVPLVPSGPGASVPPAVDVSDEAEDLGGLA